MKIFSSCEFLLEAKKNCILPLKVKIFLMKGMNYLVLLE